MDERERIEALIARNDFQTAETLMRKRGLPPEVCRELGKQIEKQKRAQKQARLRKRRRNRFASRLGNFNLRAWKGFLAVFFVLGAATAYYNRSAYLASLESWDGPPFQRNGLMDFLNFLAVLDMALFWGLILLEALLDRDSWSLERCRGVFFVWLGLTLAYLLIFLRYVFGRAS